MPALFMQVTMFWVTATGAVTTWTSASRRLPIMPSGSATPSWPSTAKSRGTTCTTSWSWGIWTPRAASMTRATSSFVISRSFPATATTPRLLKDRTWEPETPTQEREICTPAMISASSAALLIASIVASTLMMLPLRVPRLAEEPLPITSRDPEAFCSPIRTQIFEVPMSQATRKFSGLAIRTIRDGSPRRTRRRE